MNESRNDGKVLNDLESKIDALERQNFDLKMQLFYSNAAQRSNGAGSTAGVILESPNKLDNSITSYNGHINNPEIEAELSNLRHENLRLKRQISDLESMRLQATVTNGLMAAATPSIGNSHDKNDKSIRSTGDQMSPDLTQIEENRKKERRAALAVADHDRAIINHLEKEITKLLAQHTQDVDLVKRLSDQVANLTDEVGKRNELIRIRDADMASMSGKMDALTDRLRHQDLLIKQSQEKQDILLKQLADRDALILSFPRVQPASDPSTAPPIPEQMSKGNDRPLRPVEGQYEGSRDTYQTYRDTRDDISKPLAAPYEEDRTYSGAVRSDDNARWKETVPGTDKNGPMGNSLSEEVNRLQRENHILRDQLERGKNMLKSHEEILGRIRSSAEELTLLEAEEIARLNGEVDRLTKDNKRLKDRCNHFDIEVTTYRQRILELERMRSNSHRLSPVQPQNTNLSPQKQKAQERMIEMYKQREVELLNALETVVSKCQDLESKQVAIKKKR